MTALAMIVGMVPMAFALVPLVYSMLLREPPRAHALDERFLAEAALARAKVLQSYATLRAPFDGVVTARFVDPGALVAAATGSTTSVQPVLELAAMDRLRVWIYLPQDDALAVRDGDEALLTPREGSPIHATVTRVSRSLDPRTRTMLAEIVVPNVPARMGGGAGRPAGRRARRPERQRPPGRLAGPDHRRRGGPAMTLAGPLVFGAQRIRPRLSRARRGLRPYRSLRPGVMTGGGGTRLS